MRAGKSENYIQIPTLAVESKYLFFVDNYVVFVSYFSKMQKKLGPAITN